MTTFTIELRSRATNKAFTKGFTGNRDQAERYIQDIDADLNAYVLSITEDIQTATEEPTTEAAEEYVATFGSRITGKIFTKGFIGNRAQAEVAIRDIRHTLNAYIIDIKLV